MAKKFKSATSRKKSSFNLEASPWFVPVIFLLLFVALVMLFSDFVFSDKMLSGGDMLNAGYYHRAFLVDYVREHGSVPQWIPHSFGGMPFVEAFHGDIFYPLSLTKFFGSLHRMLGWSLFFHIFLAGLFMYFAARQLRLSKTAALTAGACYMFAGIMISLVAPGHEGKVYVTALYPLVILFLDRGFEKKPLLNFSLLGMVIGFIILSPHAQMSYFTLWTVSFYAAYKLIKMWLANRSIMPLIRPSLFTTYAVVIGLSLSAIQFFPGYNYTTNFSPRADTKQGWNWATSWSMHTEEAMSIIIPEFAGTSTKKAETYYWGKNVFKDNAETTGAVPIFLAVAGLMLYRRKGAWFWGGLAIFALIYALGATTPIFRLFFLIIPKVKSLRAPSMIMFLFSFSVAMLAGMGVQALIDLRAKGDHAISGRFHYWLVGFPSFMFLLAILFAVNGKGMLSLWSWLFYSEAATSMLQPNFSKLDLAYMNLPAIQSGAWLAFLFTALAALCIWLYKTGKFGVGVLVALLFIPVIDSVRFNSRFVDPVSQQQFDGLFKPSSITKFFSDQPDKFRVLNLAQVNDNRLAYFGVDLTVGYHGNQLRWYDDFLGGPALTHIRSLKPRFQNLAGSRYIIAPAGQNIPVNHFGEKPLTVIADNGQIKYLRNDNAFERVFLVDSFRVFPDRKDIVREIIDGDSDFSLAVYLESAPSLDIPSDSNSGDSAWIIDYQNDSVLVGVDISSNKILVMTDNYFDAWQVYVDGAPAELLRAYGTFRAVALPAGSKQVQFKYYPERYLSARTISGVTFGFLIFVIAGSLVMSRRQKMDRPDEPEGEDRA